MCACLFCLKTNLIKSLIMKFLCITVCVLSVCATLISASVIEHPTIELIEDNTPHYEFQYSVHDVHTGDVKDQFEHRRGDYVTGRYSLIEPDGNRRVVEYSSDPLLGFSAQVRRELLGSPHAVAQTVEEWPAPANH
uniref:Pupal cuticle protein Edg-84A n=1 Tax=Glossina pallidipes TaxID=7398 RepID=A0A1A9ZVU3_GLOPL